MFKIKDLKFKNILDIDYLQVEEHNVTCIVGKSGGGKTTLLKLLNNMISADKGEILYKDKNIEEYNPFELRREVVMLPQTPVMFTGNIRDNFEKTLRYTVRDLADDVTYKGLLEKVGLTHSLDSDTKNMSGGEKQRIALARVLLLKPETLLLDEPSSALDDETEDFIIRMVVDYSRETAGTLVMVTHSRSVAEKFADTIITLSDGKIQDIVDNISLKDENNMHYSGL
ncbi:MAG: ATP-binding cassette domain-containing protein [Fermentimonas sp.]|nr:ATP-binding cassette domain-containing protein [Fermentimonas sp.]